MRYVELFEAELNEGGREFLDAGVEPILPSEVADVWAMAQRFLPQSVRRYQTGSTHAVTVNQAPHLRSSGDMDIMVDLDEVADALGVISTDPKKRAQATKTALASHLQSVAHSLGIPSLLTRVYGINVGMALPVNHKLHQVDFELVSDPAHVHEFHRHVYDVPGFRGMHKQRLLASIARNTRSDLHPLGLAWSAFEGLKTREPNPRRPGETITGSVLTNRATQVARMLLGPDAGPGDLVDVNHILAALARHTSSSSDYEALIGDARKEFETDASIPPLLTRPEALEL